MYEDAWLESDYEDRVGGMVMEDFWPAEEYEFDEDKTDFLDEQDLAEL